MSSPLFTEVKIYQKLSRDFQAHLYKFPLDWQRFQREFNMIVEKISCDIIEFEKQNIEKYEAKVYKLKAIFEKRYRPFFLYGEYPKWVFEKPYGYAGDFQIIDNIYLNNPRSVGFDRLWDNYFVQMTACNAARERKDTLKKYIYDFIKRSKNQSMRVMNLASGPARDIKELYDLGLENAFSTTIFDCYDFDAAALNYAHQLLNNYNNVNFYQKNAIRMALTKNIRREIPVEYNLIYCVGLFDYLDGPVAVKLITNLRKLLKKDGVLIIANFGEKYRNSSAGLMEWATEWYLIYRNEDEFRNLFLSSGCAKENVQIIKSAHEVILFAYVTSSSIVD